MSRVLAVIRLMGVLLLLALSPLAMAQQDESQAATPAPEPVPARDDAAAQVSLEEAYRKEYAFLEAQRSDLRQRVESFSAGAESDELALEGAITRLENELIGIQTEADRSADLLTEAQRELESTEDSQGLLDATLQQAASSLVLLGHDEFEQDSFNQMSEVERLQQVFGRSVEILESYGSLGREQGVFYLTDGREVQGTILRVGNVAAFGVAEEGGGALAPAGDGRFKVWPGESLESARAIAAGQRPETIPMFLFENRNQAIEESPGKTVLSVIQSGGTIAWIIVILGLVAAVLIVLRILFLRRASSSTEQLLDEVVGKVRKGDMDGALASCSSRRGATARVMAAAIRNLDRDREHLEDIVSEAILHETPHLNRFGATIMVIAAVAPLLGLLGTVTGMISTFDIITEFGTGDPKLLSGGISIALVTTEVGLAVAIPALLFGNLLSGWANGIKDDMEKAALRVINVAQGDADVLAEAA